MELLKKEVKLHETAETVSLQKLLLFYFTDDDT